ncbi:MAG: hypothetical protein R3303_15230 [Marinobacter sp.]|nr:hypothetical protein [Marinobacter sp.]
MSNLSKSESATSGMSWKLAAVGSVASGLAAVISLGKVSPIVTGLIVLAAIGWGLTARDNRRAAREAANESE